MSETLKRSRRAVALLAMVLVLAMLHLLVVGSLLPSKSEGEIAALRVETMRAFYAAEAGSQVVIRRLIDRADTPAQGTILDLDTAQVEFVQTPSEQDNLSVIEGRSGRSSRRVRLEFDS